MEVEQFAIIREGLKTVGEAFRDGQGAVVVGAEVFGVPVAKGRRALAQVDGDVEDLAAQAGD